MKHAEISGKEYRPQNEYDQVFTPALVNCLVLSLQKTFYFNGYKKAETQFEQQVWIVILQKLQDRKKKNNTNN